MFKNKLFLGMISGALVLFMACQGEEKADKELTSGLYLENMDTLVKPGDNFQAYVNGTWMKNTEIPADKSSYSIGTIVREQAEENVKKIIEESASGDFEVGSDEQKVGDLYASYMNMEKRNELGAAPLKEEFEKINGLSTSDDLAAYFAYGNKYGINVPWALFIYQDFKDPTIYTVYTWQSGLGLPDREYYIKEDDRSVEIREKYQEHIAAMFDLADLDNGADAAQTVLEFETALAERHLEKEKTRDLVGLYNMFAVDTLPALLPSFNWNKYLEEAGLAEQDKMGVLMLDYTKSLDEVMRTTDMDTWKTYLKWSVIDAHASRLNEAMDKQNWSFYSKELRGTQEQRPLWRRGVSAVNRTLGEVVGKVYVKKTLST